MVSFLGKRADRIPFEDGSSYYDDDKRFLQHINTSVSAHIAEIMSPGTLNLLNFHLRRLVAADLSDVATKPAIVESGLRMLFGIGARVVTDAAIFAAFRSARIIPDRDFASLEDAFHEMYRRKTRPSSSWLG